MDIVAFNNSICNYSFGPAWGLCCHKDTAGDSWKTKEAKITGTRCPTALFPVSHTHTLTPLFQPHVRMDRAPPELDSS